MTGEELLNEAWSLGAYFQVLESGGIKVHAASPLPEELMRELRDQKAAVAALLMEPSRKTPTHFFLGPPRLRRPG